MKHTINNRFTLSSDNYNWILIDRKTEKAKRHYFPNLNQLSKFLVELKAKDCLIKGEVCLRGTNNLIPTYDAVTTKISQELIRYFLDVTKGMNYQEFNQYEINNAVSTPRFLHKELSNVLL